MNRGLLLLLFMVQLMVSGCGSQSEPARQERPVLHIAAAANLSYVIDELTGLFRTRFPQYASADIRVTKASSGSLTAQIRNNAPYDLFLAANTAYPEALYKDSLSVGEPVVYAEGVPVLVYSKTLDASRGIGFLTDDEVSRIAIAQPELAPYGQAAVEIMRNAEVYDRVVSKLVYGSSVTQTFQHAVTAVDAAFIAQSLLYGDTGNEVEKNGLLVMEFSPDEYQTDLLRQAMVLLDGENRLAADFFDFIRGFEARAVFKEYGYRVE